MTDGDGHEFPKELRASKSLGERLKIILEHNNWTIGQFAEMCGFSKSSLEKYMSDASKPGFYAILSICQNSGVSPDWLLFGVSPRRVRPAEVAAISEDRISHYTSELLYLIENAKDLSDAVKVMRERRKGYVTVTAYEIASEYSDVYLGRAAPRFGSDP